MTFQNVDGVPKLQEVNLKGLKYPPRLERESRPLQGDGAADSREQSGRSREWDSAVRSEESVPESSYTVSYLGPNFANPAPLPKHAPRTIDLGPDVLEHMVSQVREMLPHHDIVAAGSFPDSQGTVFVLSPVTHESPVARPEPNDRIVIVDGEKKVREAAVLHVVDAKRELVEYQALFGTGGEQKDVRLLLKKGKISGIYLQPLSHRDVDTLETLRPQFPPIKRKGTPEAQARDITQGYYKRLLAHEPGDASSRVSWKIAVDRLFEHRPDSVPRPKGMK